VASSPLPTDKELCERQIQVIVRQIDALVYELRPTGVPEGKVGVGYGLTEEEIAVLQRNGLTTEGKRTNG